MAGDRTRGTALLQTQPWQPAEHSDRAVCANDGSACAAMPSESIGGGRFTEGPAPEEAPQPTLSSVSNSTPSASHSAGQPVWCVLHVVPGREDAVVARVQRVAGSAVRSCFALRGQAPHRGADGGWTLREETVFPGYVFFEVDDLDALKARLADLALARLLETQEGVSTLAPEEVAFLREFGGACHTVAFSRGNIVDGRPVADEGPLKGREHLVGKIDRHRRVAYLARGMFGGRGPRVGLEVVSKS